MDVIVKKSRIHGKGVFTTRDFEKGEIVLKWDTSSELTKEQVKKLAKKDRDFVTYLNGKYILMKSPEKYVNHSCEANTTAKNQCDIARRYIKKSEEITSDYSEESVPSLNMKCNCGSKSCRGVINLIDK
ncbi:MAG: hypothetical protein HYS62_02265 [Candidatus Aenigmarchaeota archaeon]|nr:hypothetical protein [Candidatus Aenigmarchaeota archaeon]